MGVLLLTKLPRPFTNSLKFSHPHAYHVKSFLDSFGLISGGNRRVFQSRENPGKSGENGRFCLHMSRFAHQYDMRKPATSPLSQDPQEGQPTCDSWELHRRLNRIAQSRLLDAPFRTSGGPASPPIRIRRLSPFLASRVISAGSDRPSGKK